LRPIDANCAQDRTDIPDAHRGSISSSQLEVRRQRVSGILKEVGELTRTTYLVATGFGFASSADRAVGSADVPDITNGSAFECKKLRVEFVNSRNRRTLTQS
jgi:hypothetical protein